MATSYIHFTDEQKERANSIDFEYFLQSNGEQPIRSGRDKRLKSYNSITVRGNTWYDHAKEKGGYAIDFVKMCKSQYKNVVFGQYKECRFWTV